ncbi:MAG: hypothetical protein RBS08_05705 [Bdellovibrionales bacterium]|nr:hypothetical protein [Bdellovibrionales bacterium]
MNLPALRGFFMGVLRWMPQTLRHEASLRDLSEAYEGYCRAKHPPPDVPGAAFLRRMMAQFPDSGKNKP